MKPQNHAGWVCHRCLELTLFRTSVAHPMSVHATDEGTPHRLHHHRCHHHFCHGPFLIIAIIFKIPCHSTFSKVTQAKCHCHHYCCRHRHHGGDHHCCFLYNFGHMVSIWLLWRLWWWHWCDHYHNGDIGYDDDDGDDDDDDVQQ